MLGALVLFAHSLLPPSRGRLHAGAPGRLGEGIRLQVSGFNKKT
jgi:hypothetical protein